jgi:serine/threonine protein kinase
MPPGVVHRDVSPHNLFVCATGRIKLVDFGIAKTRLQTNHTRAGTLKGKLAYLAPEQIRGAVADARADVYALGIVLHEALVGRPLFRGANDAETLHNVLSLEVPPPESVRPSVPSGLGALVLRALHRDIDRRLPSAEAFADALEAIAESSGIEASADEVRAFSAELYPEDADAQEKDSALVRRTYEHLSSASLRAMGSAPWITPPQGVGGLGTGRGRLLRGIALSLGAFAITATAAFITATALRNRTHATPAAGMASTEIPAPTVAPSVSAPTPAHPQPLAAPPVATDPIPTAARTPHSSSSSSTTKPAHLGTGRLRLAANPWAEVSIDGKPVGTTPLRSAEISEGNHVVTLTNGDLHVSLRRRVAVHAGKEAVLVVDLFNEAHRSR